MITIIIINICISIMVHDILFPLNWVYKWHKLLFPHSNQIFRDNKDLIFQFCSLFIFFWAVIHDGVMKHMVRASMVVQFAWDLDYGFTTIENKEAWYFSYFLCQYACLLLGDSPSRKLHATNYTWLSKSIIHQWANVMMQLIVWITDSPFKHIHLNAPSVLRRKSENPLSLHQVSFEKSWLIKKLFRF